jgi:putative ABC transport system permease protein
MLRLPLYRADQLAFTLGGMLLVAYWSLPESAPTLVDLPPLQTGSRSSSWQEPPWCWVVLFNLAAALRPAVGLGGLPGRGTAAVHTAAADTLPRQARTGPVLAMFALVSFTLTVMAVVTNALQRSYGNVQAQTGGFDIRGDFLFANPITHLKHTLQHSPYMNVHAVTFAGSQGYVPVGVIQLSAPRPSWRLTYADILGGDFLHGTTFHLLYRARFCQRLGSLGGAAPPPRAGAAGQRSLA